MDSPETNKIPAASSSDSPLVQESPFFNYLRNLSPIKPVKATSHTSQVFPELSIPPPAPVFTSPRLNLQSEATFLNRLNCSQSIEHEDRGNTLAVGSDVFEQPISGVTAGLVSCTLKGCEANDLLQSRSCSPSGSVDEYLTDPVEADDKKSSDPSDSCLYQVDDRPVLQRGELEPMAKVRAVTDKTLQCTDTGGDLEPGKMKNSERLIVYQNKTIDINLSESSPELASGEESVSRVDTQSVGGHEGDEYNDIQETPEAFQISEGARTKSHEPAENNIANLEEAGQHHRGTRRRCLQFEASGAQKKSSINSRGYSNPAIISRSSRVSANSTDLEMLESPELDVPPPGSNSAVNSSPLMAYKLSLGSAKTQTNIDRFDSTARNSGNISKKTPLPSGIGLHLNSIVNTAAMGVQKEIPASATKYALPLTLVGTFPSKYGDSQESCSPSPLFYDNADKSEEFIQVSPQNKRKRTDIGEDEGCKHCNCKRSKCLKLYCECFAAGIYCAEPCSCHECYNKPEYIDMVFETRRIIESRNPLAFAPKIIRRTTDSPANSIQEENNKVTPSSARHKRGCNCKKSMCLKKYCECYQAGVGCSIGCRCNGCKNPFGCKEGYGEMVDIASRKVDGESWEEMSVAKLTHQEHRQTGNLTPITPTFQCSNHRKDPLKSRFPARRYLPSPESDTNVSPSSPQRIDLNNHIVFDQELEFSATGRMDQFSPKWERFEDLCSLTPLSSKGGSPSNNNSAQGRVQLQGSIRLSGSLRWRSSPITPLPRLGESKVRIEEPDSEPGYDILEDDTPDILKESRTPIKAVKVSSPNQKRVSPPCHLNSLGSSRSSPGLKSGRKFVLQSISSFPPLTPYVDPKDSNVDKK